MKWNSYFKNMFTTNGVRKKNYCSYNNKLLSGFLKTQILGYKSNKNIVNEDKNYIFSYIHYPQIYQEIG